MSIKIITAWKIFFIVLCCLCVQVNTLYAAITIETPGTATGTTANPFTFSYNIPSGTNRILFVLIESEATSGDVSTVTYNGVTLTKAVDAVVGTTTLLNVEIWYLLETNLPASGSYTVSVTFTAAQAAVVVCAMSVSGLKQNITEPEAINSTTNAAANTYISTSITTLTDNALVIDVVGSGNPVSWSCVSPSQRQFNLTSASTASGAGSTRIVHTAGQVTNGWTAASSSNRSAHAVACFASEPEAVKAQVNDAIINDASF